MDKYKPASLPIDFRVSNSMLSAPENQQADKDKIFWYGAVIGLLIYAMTMTRSDLEYALFMVSQYYANLDSIHIALVVQILRYIYGTLHYCLIYAKS